MKGKALFLIFIVFSLSFMASADDIENEIKEALTAYKKGEYSKASELLETASQEIRQIKAQKLETLFPKAFSGWTTEKVQTTTAGRIFLGGVISGSRKYLRGSSVVDINIATDNPMISFVSSVISNPMMLSVSGSVPGAPKVTKIKGRKAIEEWDETQKTGSIKIVINDKALVSVTGSNCQKSDIRRYAEAIDYEKIQKFISE